LNHRLQDSIIVKAPINEVWEYYTDVKNISKMTLPQLGMKVVKAEVPLRKNSRVRFRLQPPGIPFPIYWDAQIVEFEKPNKFVDKQIKGPFSRWIHEHEFEALDENRTKVTDSIELQGMTGLLSSIGSSFLIGSRLEVLFDHRAHVLDQKFGVESES